MILQIFFLAIFAVLSHAAIFTSKSGFDGDSKVTLHKVDKFLTISVPENEDQRLMMLEDYGPYVQKLRDVIKNDESTVFEFFTALHSRPEFHSLSLKRYLSQRIVYKALTVAADRKKGRRRFEDVKELLSWLPVLSETIPWEFEPQMVNNTELFDYDEIMYRFVSLAYHIDNNDIAQALADYGYNALESPIPIVLSIKDGNYQSVAKMVQMGASLKSPVIWNALIEAPAGEGNRKFAYLEYFLKNGFMEADDEILGSGWIDFALQSKSSCFDFIIFMVSKGAKSPSPHVLQVFLNDRSKPKAYRVAVENALKAESK